MNNNLLKDPSNTTPTLYLSKSNKNKFDIASILEDVKYRNLGKPKIYSVLRFSLTFGSRVSLGIGIKKIKKKTLGTDYSTFKHE